VLLDEINAHLLVVYVFLFVEVFVVVAEVMSVEHFIFD
jgi:hypothetical protein